MTAVTENGTTVNTENEEAKEPRYATFVDFQRAVWEKARTLWDNCPRAERDQRDGDLCENGLNGYLVRVRLPKVNAKVGYFDAWLAMQEFEGAPDTRADDVKMRELARRTRRYLSDEGISRDRANRWLTDIGIDELDPPRTQRYYTLSTLEGHVLSREQVQTAIDAAFPDAKVQVTD